MVVPLNVYVLSFFFVAAHTCAYFLFSFLFRHQVSVIGPYRRRECTHGRTGYTSSFCFVPFPWSYGRFFPLSFLDAISSVSPASYVGVLPLTAIANETLCLRLHLFATT